MTSLKREENYNYYLFLFFFVSIFSCFLEFLYSLFLRNKIVKPGVLFGLWCPIYGVTALILSLTVNKKNKKIYNLFSIFSVATIVEYIGSYISSEFFRHYIWDYSNYSFNINGRVCLQMTMCFTMMGYFQIYKIEPLIKKLYYKIGRRVNFINFQLLFLFLLDIFLKIISKK